MNQNEIVTRNHREYDIVLFDGVCNFCEASVNFIIQRDSQKQFYFMAQSSDDAQHFIKEHQLESLDTIMLVSKGKLYTHSDAALEISKGLDGWYRHLYLFRFVPKFLRDWVYKLVGKYRYRIFGKKKSCMMPSDEVRERFLG